MADLHTTMLIEQTYLLPLLQYMSSTSIPKVEGLLAWLEENAFWNSDLVEVRESLVGGTGVFWKLKDQPDPSQDSLILRIPKSSILSPKNSCLCNLLMDYEPSDPAIDLTQGMHAIVLTYIYEQALGERSPWYAYLDTFDLNEEDDQYLPLCLWSKIEKEALFNSECDMLNMLDSSELILFYLECVNFAKTNTSVLEIPPTLSLDTAEEVDENTPKLRFFAKCVQAVISRAFTVDKFHGLSLVPGADLFNHLLPIKDGDKIVPRENVHFVCDDDEDLCGDCGEMGCEHDESDEEIEEEVLDEDGSADEEGQEEDDAEEDTAQDNNDIEDLMEDIPLSSDSEDSDDDGHSSETESINEDDEAKEDEEKKTLLMEDIERFENSDAETDQDEEEVSTLSLSEDEENDEGHSEHQMPEENDNGSRVDLAKELSESSKCCDIMLTALPSKEHDYELFNTYGNELANPYLLQRYGFVSKGNPNTSYLLSVPMFAYLKKLKANEKTKASLDIKLDWYESIGFELVNELCGGCQDDDCNDCGEKDQHGCCDDDDCGDCDDKGKDCESQEPPESWQLLPRIHGSGEPTKQTKALLHLLIMPFKVFYHKLAQAPSERKTAKRVEKYLLEPELSKTEKTILRGWVESRLQRYRAVEPQGPRAENIACMMDEEKALLEKALKQLL